MKKYDIKDTLLDDTDILVELLPDYYGKDDQFRVKEPKHDVGVVAAAGKDINKKLLGKVVYIEKNVCDEVELKGIGVFRLAPKEYVVLYRTDQDKENY